MDDPAHRYELVERIAVGGMAEVFLAKTYGSHGFEKTLAIKRILPDLAASSEFERRFIAEAKIAVTLSHANIVQVLDFSRFGDSLYIAMEYVDGLDLAALLKASPDGRLPIGAALHVATEMLKGLDFAHRRGVVHRDVSPSNVLVSRAGEVKIADFGIALATQTGSDHTGRRRIMGKWRYMSPEQTRGDDMDARSDLFSAAAVMFEVFTGARLFAGDDAETIVRNIMAMNLPRASDLAPGLPTGIDEVLAGMLARDPAERTETAADALNTLVDISYSQAVQATAMTLARVADEVMPAPRRAVDRAASSRLIDDIINSEINAPRRKDKTRVTIDDARMPTFATADVGGGATGLSFVGSTRTDGVTNWILEPTIASAATLLDERVRHPEGTKDLDVAERPPAGESTTGVAAAARELRRPRRQWLLAIVAAAGTAAVIAIMAGRGDEPTPRQDRAIAATAEAAPSPAIESPADPGPARALGSAAGAASVNGAAAHATTRAATPTPAGQTDRKPADKPRTGTIDLYVEPWADVYLRGRKIGTAPQRGLRLPVGRQRLRLVNPVQNRATSITVTVPGERPYRVSLP